ncbi:cytochrome-c peroxidase [Abyssalbus ytuae]|uniref:Methylamine utilization protein MauG n=1 Tax=Abyssalbus ytuae TaxID=2926907 RepID=A0A9E7D0I8_9FLAO|nr:cytochrome c peroxidase [Abyssalbus ytuae]UOB16058.1 cytochrome-c peroxidase [Abyssalbus ytuae]
MKRGWYLILVLLLIALVTSWKQSSPSISELRKIYSNGDTSLWPKAYLHSSVVAYFEEIGPLPDMVFPENNSYSDAKRDLGKMLFFDPRLSQSGQIACASCHDSQLGWADGRRVSFGHDRRIGKRNAMSILNTGFVDSLFWDGRADSLEDQVHFPVTDTVEMNAPFPLAIANIKKIKGYHILFQNAFGDSAVTQERVARAIATYERTLVSRNNRFDKFVQGDSTQLTDNEVLGLHLFRTKARCINCHHSPLFSDNHFHNTGLSYYGRKYEDLGRYNVTGKKDDVGKFRTASLRELQYTAPYMHNGLFPVLSGVINMYDAGMPRPKRKGHQLNDSLFPTTTPLVEQLSLTDHEKQALLDFLLTLSQRRHREAPPELVQ